MLQYIFRRTIYSILIIFGVLILTFLLFNAAAGDPAAALLGKNPSPREIEDLRQELGRDKPLFFGRYRRTETFRSVDFKDKRMPRGISVKGQHIFNDDVIVINRGRLLFKRNFQIKEPIVCKVTFSGSFKYQGRSHHSRDTSFDTIAFDVPPDVETLVFSSY